MRVCALPRATTSERTARLSPLSVCLSPACITIPSYARPIPPILSCVAGSEHMHQDTLQRATRRPRIVCSDRYERHAAADDTSCPHIASNTLASCPLCHDCSIRACVGVRSTALRPRSFMCATRVACSGLLYVTESSPHAPAIWKPRLKVRTLG